MTMKHKNPEAQRLEVDYLSRLREALTGIPDRDIEEIIQEVHRHIEDAIAELPDETVTLSKMAGILEILGPPESFAEKKSSEETSPSPTMNNGQYELPVFATLHKTFVTLADNFLVLFKTLFLPSLIIFLLSIPAGLVGGHISTLTPDRIKPELVLVGMVAYLVYIAIYVVLVTIMAVTCHRIILLGEGALPNPSGFYFSLRELKYLGWGALLFVPSSICIFIFSVIMAIILSLLQIRTTDSALVFMGVSTMVPFFIAILITAPFILVLPATAVEAERPLSQAREASRGNSVRLAVILFLPTLIMMIFWTPLYFVGGNNNSIPFHVLNGLIAIVYVVYNFAVLSVSYKALAYEH